MLPQHWNWIWLINRNKLHQVHSWSCIQEACNVCTRRLYSLCYQKDWIAHDSGTTPLLALLILSCYFTPCCSLPRVPDRLDQNVKMSSAMLFFWKITLLRGCVELMLWHRLASGLYRVLLPTYMANASCNQGTTWFNLKCSCCILFNDIFWMPFPKLSEALTTWNGVIFTETITFKKKTRNRWRR